MAEDSNAIDDFFSGLTNTAQGVFSSLADFQLVKQQNKFLIAQQVAESNRIVNQRAPEASPVTSVGFTDNDKLIVGGIGVVLLIVAAVALTR